MSRLAEEEGEMRSGTLDFLALYPPPFCLSNRYTCINQIRCNLLKINNGGPF